MPTLELPLRIGTRASPLAMAQAKLVRDALRRAHGWAEDAVQLCPVIATGDRIQDRALADVGGKALWTKELDLALLEGRIDIAVHSMKDVETIRPGGIALAAMLPRADVRDRLIGAAEIAAIPSGARFGTSAPRRRAQILRLRPDLEIVLLRGNVQTRLARIENGEIDATLLASAGLARLGLDDVGTPIPVATLLPAPAQGAIGIETRADNARVQALLEPINDGATFACVSSERALLAGLAGDCRSPVAALSVMEGSMIHLRAEIYTPDGSLSEADEAVFRPGDDTPAKLAKALLARSAPEIRANFAG